MSKEQVIADALELPLSERVSLAQALWQSIDADLGETVESDAIREAIVRDRELSSGDVAGRTHEDVIQAARQAVRCV